MLTKHIMLHILHIIEVPLFPVCWKHADFYKPLPPSEKPRVI